ncbi:MAG: DNA-directed DNA polymerase [Sclerophora amabilis]|nr:MAG: DNA-directed DNA polymerase [Sclerophora amabilis]
MADDPFILIRPYFEDLANDEETRRLEASYKILSNLEDADRETIWRALERLIRGLASGRKSARIGFSITLAELLSRICGLENEFPSTTRISLSEVLEVLKSRTQPAAGSNSRQEERDHCLGRLFGLEAVLDAGVLFISGSTEQSQRDVVSLVLELAKKKSWLREECGWILCKAVRANPQTPFGESFARTVVEQICEKDLAHTPEGVAIWLSIQSRYPDIRLPKSPWHHRDPLHPKNMTTLPAVMKESSQPVELANEKEEQQRGMWNSKPHFSWDILFDRLSQRTERQREGSSKSKCVSFSEFWNAAVDNNLFAANASDERKHWGFSLFSKVMTEHSKDAIPDVFSKNMMRCLINQLSNRERYLHRTALKTLKTIHARVEREPGVADIMLFGLISGHGIGNFDQVTKTKTVATLLSQANPDALTHVVRHFDGLIQNPATQDTKGAESKRQYLADQLLSAVRAHKAEQEDEWLNELLDVMSKYAYFTVFDSKHPPDPPISAVSRKVFASRLSSCFTSVMATKAGDAHQWLYRVLSTLKTRERTPAGWSAVIRFDDSTGKANDSAWKKVERIRKTLYNGDSDALSVLQDLESCYDQLVRKKSHTDNDPSEVLVEVLLGLISKPSALLRNLAQEVFSAFAGDVNLAGLQALFKILESKESLAGQQDLFDKELDESEDDVSVVDVEEMEAASDQDGASSKEDESQGDAAETASSDAESDDDDTEMINGDDAEEAARLNAALAQIVRTQPFDEQADDHSGSSDDEKMDDDQMFALDDQMANVFRERKKISDMKTEKREAKETMLHFKNRVLDLLQVYVKHQHTNPLSPELLLPLLSLIRSTSSKQVSDKACALIRDFSQRCKGTAVPVVESAVATNLLDRVHAEAMREASRSHAAACSQSSLLLAKVAVAIDHQNIEKVVARYAETQTRWLKGECQVQPLLFSDLINWGTSYSKAKQKQKQ